MLFLKRSYYDRSQKKSLKTYQQFIHLGYPIIQEITIDNDELVVDTRQWPFEH